MFKFRRSEDVPKVEITVSNRTVVRIIALILLSVLFFAALKTAQHALTLIFVAFFLALALNAPVHWIDEHMPRKRKGGNRALATAVSFLIVVAIIAAFLASIVPPIVRQSNNLISSAPGLVDDLRNQNSSVGKFVRRYHLQSQVNTFSQQLGDRLKHVSGSAVSTITAFGSSVFSILTVLALTYMMLLEGPRWLKKFHGLIPQEKQAYASKLTGDMYQVIRGYVNGQVLLAAIASLFIAPMLFFLHISYPIALIFVVFICGLIPMVGHTIGAIIVTLVALFHSIPSAVLILAYYILYQQIENYLIQPRIQANSTNLSPLLVFMAVVIGVSFSGLLGGLVAIPIMGCLRVIAVDQIKRRHMLHESISD